MFTQGAPEREGIAPMAFPWGEEAECGGNHGAAGPLPSAWVAIPLQSCPLCCNTLPLKLNTGPEKCNHIPVVAAAAALLSIRKSAGEKSN